MKKLFLKNGMFVWVKVAAEKIINRDNKIISVYEETTTVGSRPSFSLIYSLQNTGAFNMNMVFADGVTELQFYEVTHAAEIIENFEQYFNNLNQ